MLDGHVGMRRRLAHRAAAVRLVDGVGLGLVRVGVRGRGRVTVTVRVRVRVEVGDVGLCLGAERRRHGNLGAGVRPHPMLPLGTERLGRSSGVRRAARAQSLAPQAAGAASRGTTAKTAPSIVQQGGCGVAAGEHLLGLLGRPVVELEGERLGDVRADVPAAVVVVGVK